MINVYGHPASQPSRTVIWACVLQAQPIRLITADLADNAFINSRGQVPIIDDDGFVLSEMPAILTYLAAAYGWSSLYPANIRLQARINEYLHTHHSLTRLATTKVMAPHVLAAFGGNPASNPLSYINNLCIQTSMESAEGLAEGHQVVTEIISFLERSYLSDHDFIAGTSQASIADLACYEEIGQLEEASLFDFSENRQVYAWLNRMRELPYHDEVHRYNSALGDLQTESNSMARFGAAVNEAFTALSKLTHIRLA